MQKVVISGTYHRDPAGLARIFRELEVTQCRILSPISINFTDPTIGTVKTASEKSFSSEEIEKFHLRAIREADFVWLHCPDGYVGLTGSFEIGFATALGVPVFGNQIPHDERLRTQVGTVKSVFEALEFLPAATPATATSAT